MELGPNQRAWVDALRSGKYQQTSSVLQDTEGHCCLGVACDVARLHGTQVTMDGAFIDGSSLDEQPLVMDWLGLRDGEGCIGNIVGGWNHLTAINDLSGHGFDFIADTIEQNAETLFIEPR